MIEFKGVSYCYGKTEDKIIALNNINLVINEGEFIAILGPNGSGKSTLAKHMNGLLTPTKGTVFVDGLSTCDTSSLWQIRQRVGMVFQNPDNQIVATSVEEDIAFGPENLGLDSKEICKRIDEALEIVGMRAYAKHEPHMLSGGQKQKIAIAGALAMHSKYLVIDEATSMLDPGGRADTMETLKTLNKERGITVINITHVPDEAAQADKIIVLSDGAIVKIGAPKEVFADSSELAALGIGIPKAKLIADELISAGLSLPPTILTVDELVGALC